MLCCVSRRAVTGADQRSSYIEHYSLKEQPVEFDKVVEAEQHPEPDVPPILLPCATCARTFTRQSLEKHTKICQKAANKKRRPFDSSKQRIQGTELAAFVPKQEKRRHVQDDRTAKPTSTWKQTHDDFLRAIRAARNEVTDTTMQKLGNSTATPNAPTRANEQGVCPTCNRHFGIKAYDRHVAWCKERIVRVPTSPATSVAKERLEARMKYRAPGSKNRRQTTREKYSPGSAVTLNSGSKTSPTLISNKIKETISVPNCTKGNDSPVKQKSAVTRRPTQAKESCSPAGPMKSRSIDRTNRQPEDDYSRLSHRSALPIKRPFRHVVPPLSHKKEIFEEQDRSSCSKSYRKQARKIEDNVKWKENRSSEEKCRVLNSARSQKGNIVSARSQGNPKVNDVSINADIMGVTVKPCSIHKGNEFTTWKQISQTKSNRNIKNSKEVAASNIPENIRLPDINDQTAEKYILNNRLLELASAEDTFRDDTCKLSSRSGSTVWSIGTTKLNRTYSFKDSVCDDFCDIQGVRHKNWKPVRHSPRIEFCLGDPEKMCRLQASASSLITPNIYNVDNNSKSSHESLMKQKTETRILKTPETKEERIPNDLQCEEENISSETERPKSISESLRLVDDTILKKERLESTVCSEFSLVDNSVDRGNCSDNRETMDLLENYTENDMTIGNTNLTEIRNEEELQYSKRSDQFEYSDKLNNSPPISKSNENCKWKPEEDTCKIYETLDSGNDKEETNEFVLDLKEEVESIPDESEFSMKSEAESLFIKDVLSPTGASTPLQNLEECTTPECENSKEKSCSPTRNDEWKMEIVAETGTELLYRVENEHTNSVDSSLDNRINEPIDMNVKSEIMDLENHESPENAGALSNVVLAVEEEKKRLKPEKMQQKEDANQINLCKCTITVSPENICNKDDNTSEFETHLCNDSLNDENLKQKTIVDNSPEPQIDIDFRETSKSAKANCDYKEQNTADNDREEKSEIFIETVMETINSDEDEVQEIYKNYASNDFDDDSDNSIHESMEQLHTSFTKNDTIDVRNLQSIILSKSRVKLRKSLTSKKTAFKSERSKVQDMENKIRESMYVLNDSDSIVSSTEEMDTADIKESVELETIEEIGTRNRSVRVRIFPEIKGTSMVVEENYDKREKINPQMYWEKAMKASKNRLINLNPPYQGGSKFLKRNPKVRILPPVPSSSLIKSSGKDYDPFLLAEQQMNDLLSDTSDSPSVDQNRETAFPLFHSSAFVKYPYQSSHSSPEKRSSLIAPPSQFDDFTSDFSSDSTETNSLSREVFLRDMKDSKEIKDSISKSDSEKKSPGKELGRRVIIDKSKALGGESVDETNRGSRSFVGNTEKARKILDKVSPNVVRPTVNRSLSVRASSAPKITPDRKNSNNFQDAKKSTHRNNDSQKSSNTGLNNRNNNYVKLSNSNLSLSSIVSSDTDIKRSNSVFDELINSFEDEHGSFTSLKSLLKNDSLSVSSPVHGRLRNGQISDDELSSPESYKRQDHSKLSADSAYSSLNRKYSNHGRSTIDMVGRLEEDQPRNRREGEGITVPKCKMSKFCHECGSKFPETAKFCCECGIRRLIL